MLMAFSIKNSMVFSDYMLVLSICFGVSFFISLLVFFLDNAVEGAVKIIFDDGVLLYGGGILPYRKIDSFDVSVLAELTSVVEVTIAIKNGRKMIRFGIGRDVDLNKVFENLKEFGVEKKRLTINGENVL